MPTESTDLSPDSNNMVAVQYGVGTSANFNSFSPSLRTTIDGEIPEGTDISKQSRLRIMDVLNWTSDKWSMQGVAIYQEDDLGLDEDSNTKWYSIGARPVYHFNSLYNLA